MVKESRTCHVVIHFVKTYPRYKVVNFDKLDYCSCLRNLSEIAGAPNYVFVKGDISSSDLVNYVLKVEKVDTILHFAAQTHVGEFSLTISRVQSFSRF